MFLVITVSPLDSEWGERDNSMYLIAGRRSDKSLTNTKSTEKGKGTRQHTWTVRTVEEAQHLMKLLKTVEMVNVTFRER